MTNLWTRVRFVAFYALSGRLATNLRARRRFVAFCPPGGAVAGELAATPAGPQREDQRQRAGGHQAAGDAAPA